MVVKPAKPLLQLRAIYQLNSLYIRLVPVWNGGQKNEIALLKNCYINSLKIAIENNIKTIAFPNISTGIYHFPKEKAAEIAFDVIKTFEQNNHFNKIIFVCFDEENYNLYLKYLN